MRPTISGKSAKCLIILHKLKLNYNQETETATEQEHGHRALTFKYQHIQKQIRSEHSLQ